MTCPERAVLLLQLSSPTNVASIVVHQALGKALARFNQAISRDQQQQQLKQMAEPHAQQGRKPGAAYQVADGAGELSYDELKVRSQPWVATAWS